MLTSAKSKKSSKTNEIEVENENLKTQIQELQVTIDQLNVKQVTKDNIIQQSDAKIMSMKQSIINLQHQLESLQQQQQEINNKLSEKDKGIQIHKNRINEYKSNGASSHCPQKHRLKAFEASNIDKCSKCGNMPAIGDQMRGCFICNYNKCYDCYLNKPISIKKGDKEIKITETLKVKKVKSKIKYKGRQKLKKIPIKSKKAPIINERDWEKLKKIPTRHFSDAVQINLNDFVIATTKGIYKYNRKGWKLYIKYPTYYKAPYQTKINHYNGYCTLSVDRDKQKLYLYTNLKNGIMAEIDMHSKVKGDKKWVITKDLKSVGQRPISLVIHSRVHIFGGMSYHLLWNPLVKSLKMMEGFTNIHSKSNGKFGVVYIERYNKLLVFGSKSIWQYILDEHEWIKCEYSLSTPIPSCHFAWIITNDERFVIIFGQNTKDILILDTERMKTKLSAIKMPFIAPINAMIMDNKGKYDILIRGYVREEFKNKYIGNDVLYLIVMWSVTNDIHIFRKDNNNEHWRINVETILGLFDDQSKGIQY